MVKKKEESISSLKSSEAKNSGIFGSRIFQIFLFSVVAVAIGFAIFFFLKYQQEQQKARQITGQSSATDIKNLITQVSKLMVLPNETPQVATVSDITKLSNQPFFAKAVNGDKVLIYSNSGRAILFRPSIDKIINVAQINPQTSNSSAAQSQASPSAAISKAPIKIVILNGTKTSGLARSASSKITNSGLNISTTTGNSQNDYNTTVVVDLTGKNKSQVAQIITAIGGKSSSLPADETKPANADILIILGADYIKP